MTTPTPITTPSRSSAVSPVRWMRAFAFTPDTDSFTRLRNDSQHLAVDGNEDALPTHFQPHTRSRAGPLKGCGPVSGEGNGSTVPANRRQRRRGSEVSLSLGTADGLSATHGSSIGNTQSRTWDRSAKGESDHKDPVPSRSRASLTRPRSGRVVLDAVEIVSGKRSRTRTANVKTVCHGCPTESVHSTSSHYPSPPVSHASAITDPGNRAGLDPGLPLKASKYFAPASTLPTRTVPEYIPVVTPPSSPILTLPTYIESSDFEYPPPDASLDKRDNNSSDEAGYDPRWHNNPGLFSDLMVMLRRLKPILIQESVRDDPWKVLIAARLLNVTTGKAAIPVFCKIVSHWPTPQDLAHAPRDELIELLRPLGLYNKRANWLKDISEQFLEDLHGWSCPETSLASLLSEERAVHTLSPLHYPGVGPYALDSLRIFCASDKDAWKHVMPRDKELVRYLRWRWAVEEGKVWYPGMGVIRDANVPYLITLVDELAMHYDNAIGGEGTKYTITLETSDGARPSMRCGLFRRSRTLCWVTYFGAHKL